MTIWRDFKSNLGVESDQKQSLNYPPSHGFTHIIFSPIYKPLLTILLPLTYLQFWLHLSPLPPSLCVCVPLCSHCMLSPCCFVNFFPPCCRQMDFCLGVCKCHVPVPSCHFRWWPGWCHVNDWRPWSPHTSCCSSCAPCWSWALFTTPPGSYIYTYGVRSLVSDVSSLTVCNIYSSPDHPSLIAHNAFETYTCFYLFYWAILFDTCLFRCLPLCADCQLTVRLFQCVFWVLFY